MEEGVWRHGCGAGQKAEGVVEGERKAQEAGGRSESGQRHTERGLEGKLLSPPARRKVVEMVCEKLEVSQRRACQVLTQPRATQRYALGTDLETETLVRRIVELASRYGRYGYRRVTAMLRREGWRVNHKRVERIWKVEGLKVPQKQPKRG